jgi:mRNA interferase RelE/StbE
MAHNERAARTTLRLKDELDFTAALRPVSKGFRSCRIWLYSGQMRHEILVSPEAAADFKRLSARRRATLRDAFETHLRYEPSKTSRSRIRRLRGLRKPQYRLRVDDLRVFYDVSPPRVEVLAIVPKSEATAWLEREGVKS